MALSAEVTETLAAAGWQPDRDRSKAVESWLEQLGDQFPVFPGISEVLHRFGGLNVRLSRPGEVWSRQSSHIDPSLALGEDDRFADFSRMLGIRLFPLGEIGHQAFFALGEDGKAYALMLDLWLVGNSMDEAIEVLVRGRAGALLIDESMYGSWVSSEEGGSSP